MESYKNDCKSRTFYENHVFNLRRFCKEKKVPNKQVLYDVYVETTGLVGVVYVAVFKENGKVKSANKYLYIHK